MKLENCSDYFGLRFSVGSGSPQSFLLISSLLPVLKPETLVSMFTSHALFCTTKAFVVARVQYWDT